MVAPGTPKIGLISIGSPGFELPVVWKLNAPKSSMCSQEPS